MNTLKDRLIFLWKDQVKQATIAKEIGMTIAGFGRIWNNNGLPKAEVLKKIKELKGCSIDWLLTGEGEPFPDAPGAQGAVRDTLGNNVNLNDFVFIPRYKLEPATEQRNGNAHDTADNFTFAFSRQWLEKHINASTNQLSVITVKGDAMEGVFNDGDSILVNHADNTPKDGLYVLRIEDNLTVKRLQIMPGNIVRIISANSAYPAYEVNLRKMSGDIAVIGRVEWFGRSI
ncbi:helix-turn-helix transcriptional regulator [Neisseria sp.]|uniref:helix-turn-helix transcriptional regulator n=1 Tax=Neisseria sp. TaxID=192066 RepID=UPI00289D2EA0|nr:helix-turn-helix transcriptional regulator [Neisseria sp.]